MVASSPSDRGERLRGTLADPAVLAERVAARRAPHMLPLTHWVEELRSRRGVMPDVDPLDGGIGARLLLLLETPGPGFAPLRFVSRDNPTGTGGEHSAVLRGCGPRPYRHDLMEHRAVGHP